MEFQERIPHRVAVDDPSHSLEEIWPPFGLRIESPRLVLRVVRETDFPQYVAAATAGVTHTDTNPFAFAWNENPAEELVRSSLPWLWSTRGRIGPDDWYLMLGVFLKHDDDGPPGSSGEAAEACEVLIGMQDVFAEDWRVLRSVTSGSWLRADQQGQGYGREMRAAMLLWAFDHFGAEYADSGAYEWNTASRRVSEGLGYAVVGTRRMTGAHGDRVEYELQFRLAKEDFVRPEWGVQVSGNGRLHSFLEAGSVS